MQSKFYIVLVEYSSKQDMIISKYFNNLRYKFEFELIRVRTDLTSGSFIENLNEGYEFSGYQEGLSQILSKLNSCQSNSSNLKIVFLNDTFFSSHFSSFSNKLLGLLTAKKYDFKNKFIGIKSFFGASYNSNANEIIYISTWAFVLIGRPEDFGGIVFYDLEEVNRFYGGYSNSEYILKYKNTVDEWLNPSRFMRGWYKSSLRFRLESETQRRKQLAIYFEHTLPNRLSQMGFEVHDVLSGENYLTRLIFNFLAIFDRLSLQCKKFTHRSIVNIQSFIHISQSFLGK